MNNMRIRIISGAVYFAIWLALFVIKCFVPSGWGALGFDAFFCAASVIAALEFTRAARLPEQLRITVAAFCAAVCAVFVAIIIADGISGGTPVALWPGFAGAALLFGVFLAASLIITCVCKCGFKNFGLAAGGAAYCGLLFCMLSAVNHLSSNSLSALILIFAAVSLTDTCAYFTGKFLGKYVPYKLAPRTSPNKTVIGAAGGLIGGMAGGVIAYYVSLGLCKAAGLTLAFSVNMHPAVLFLLFGLALAVIGQAGDLTESAIKRRFGVKDMGNIMPGHGGVLDRFDSILFCGVAVFALFLISSL